MESNWSFILGYEITSQAIKQDTSIVKMWLLV